MALRPELSEPRTRPRHLNCPGRVNPGAVPTGGRGVAASAAPRAADADTARTGTRQGLAVTRAARRSELLDPRPVAGELAQAVVEVLAGDRPVTQLLTRFDDRTYGQLAARAPDPVTHPTLRSARAGVHPWERPKIRTVHVSCPADGVAEVTARVQTNGRSRAVALRLEEWEGRWRCSALDVG